MGKKNKKKRGKNTTSKLGDKKYLYSTRSNPKTINDNKWNATRSETARRKDSIKKKVTKRQQQFRLKNNKQNKNNAEKNAKPRHDT